MAETLYNGYRRLDFLFEGHEAILVCPKVAREDRRYLMKTEYFSAFQELEMDMLARGYHLAYIKNDSRWAQDDDSHRRARFADHLTREFGLHERMIPIGMSCGGFHAVSFAALYPNKVSLLYLDAPLLSFLSYPYGMGKGEVSPDVIVEIERAYGFDLAHALAYNGQPIHRLPLVVRAGIPVALVYGDADTVVMPEENAHIIIEQYEEAKLPLYVLCKKGCDHHPHGPLDRMEEVIEFIESNML